jgi:3-hydroxyacyl-[acyl-carrier-protein] dehydratase
MRWMLIDKIVECEPGKNILAVKCFTRSELFLMDHFSFYPIVPGVLQIEMIAQAIGKCLKASDLTLAPALGAVKSAKFFGTIEPGSRCEIRAEVLGLSSSYARGQGTVFVDGEKKSSAEVLFGFLPSELTLNAKPDEVVVEWLNKQKRLSKMPHQVASL